MKTMASVIESGNEWRRWRELINEIENSNRYNYKIRFDEDGFWTDNEDEIEDYPLDGDVDLNIAVEKNDCAYDAYCGALMAFAEELGAEYSCPYGNSWYIVKGNKTISFRDHDIAKSTFNHHDAIYDVRHLGGIAEGDIKIAVEWINE